MAVIAMFTYDVKPGRMDDFRAKLNKAAEPRFASRIMPKSFRLFRSTVPGPDTGSVIMMLEYDDMAAYGERTAFENSNPEWKKLFEAQPDSPEILRSVQLLTEM
jgi:quinol monooxygenase YgiN